MELWINTESCSSDLSDGVQFNGSGVDIPKSIGLSINFRQSEDNIILDLYTLNEITVNVELIDILGQVLEVPLSNELLTGSREVNINTENLSAGVYFIRINCGNNNKVLKFCVIR